MGSNEGKLEKIESYGNWTHDLQIHGAVLVAVVFSCLIRHHAFAEACPEESLLKGPRVKAKNFNFNV